MPFNLQRQILIKDNSEQTTRPTLSRRQFLSQLGTIATSTTLLAACSSGDAAPTPVDGEPTSIPEPSELIFWGHEQHPVDLAAEGFVEQNPSIKWISPHPENLYDQLMAAIAAGTGIPDLFWAEGLDVQTWGCKNLLNDLSDIFLPEIANYHPLKVNEALIAKTNQYMGWPGDLGVCGWYYRVDKLQAAGYGNIDFENYTWQDFCTLAADLKTKDLYAFAFPADGWSPLFMFILHQLGGTVVSQDGQTITVGDEKGIYAMQLVKQLWDAGGLTVDMWSVGYWAALRDGELIGDFATAWSRGFWEAQLKDSGESGGVGQWRIAKLPTGNGIQYRTGTWVSSHLVNPKGSQNIKNARAFMQYALGSLAGTTLCGKWGIIPAYHPYLEAKDFLDIRSFLFGDWAFDEFWAEQEKELSAEFYRPAGWSAVNDVLMQEMVPILKGDETVEDGMKRIVEIAAVDFDRTKCQ